MQAPLEWMRCSSERVRLLSNPVVSGVVALTMLDRHALLDGHYRLHVPNAPSPMFPYFSPQARSTVTSILQSAPCTTPTYGALLKRNTQLLYCLHCYRFDPSSICVLVVLVPHPPLILSHAPASWVNSIAPRLVTRNQQVHSAMWSRFSYLDRPESKSSLGTHLRVHILRSFDRFVTLSPLER